MTTRAQLPEDARKEPHILSPEEDAERAARRREETERRIAEGQPGITADPDEPLRQPGELSDVPREDR